jgi:DNA-binding transcriptional LysR family regulator
MSQPPLSQQIAALEHELGTALLMRDRRSVRLTAAGEAFLRRARALLDQASVAATEARRVGRGELGRVVVGFMSSAMLSRFPSMLRRFHDANPDVAIDLLQFSPREQIEAVAQGRIDIGFLAIAPAQRRLSIDTTELRTERIWEEELVAAIPADHKLAKHETIPLRALATEDFVTLTRTPETGHYDHVLKLCERKGGFHANVTQEVEQLPVALALIASGFGVSLMPLCAIDGWKNLIAFPRLKELPRIPVSMIWRADNTSSALQAFRHSVLDQADRIFYAATGDAEPDIHARAAPPFGQEGRYQMY